MSITKDFNCKWHFPIVPENMGDEGPKSALLQTFAHFPSAALVRESIQNSLDAAIDDKKPVKVCFEYSTIEKEDFPDFFKLSEHASACADYYHNDKTARTIYPEMAEMLNSRDEEIGYIKVSDYNTKGMNYTPGGVDTPFYAFVRAAGVSTKDKDGAGGSFGFGKGAFYMMSPLNTLFVSTQTNDGKLFFEGVSRLCSHKIDGNKHSHIGFYDNNYGAPIKESDKIPEQFRRKESGTSICIMGISDSKWDEIKDELAKEVLRNFFMAVLSGKLVVVVNGHSEENKDALIIDKDSIKEQMKKLFKDTRDVRSNKKPYNPRPYFEAVIEATEDTCYKATLPTIGNVTLYLKEFTDNVTQIIFMRKPLMKVYRSSFSLGNFNCVFVCEDDKGNNILRDMENPEHNSWSEEECRKTDKDTSYETAVKASDEIDDFISKCIDDVLGIDEANSAVVAELERYLPSMTGEKGKGEKGNPFTGTPSGKYVKEGVSLNTEGKIQPVRNVQRPKKGNIAVIKKGNVKDDPTSEKVAGTGGHKGGGGGTHHGPGNNFRHVVIEDGDGRYKELIPVEWRPVKSKKGGCTDIVIYSDVDIKGGELKFEIGRESTQGKDNGDIVITNSNKGKCDGLTLTGVDIKAKPTKNIIQISFSDQMLHSLKLSVYEIK